MARNAARRKLGYYPLVENEAKRIRSFFSSRMHALLSILAPELAGCSL
jgi:hypothetical protein